MKSWVDAHKDEQFTDNTKITYCADCEDCRFWGNNPKDFFSNFYTKACCDKYPYPGRKPMDVINSIANCTKKEPRRGR